MHRVFEHLQQSLTQGGLAVLVTGAGISAASGIPTFRGPEGYWTVGSEVYRPEQLATYAAFRRMPREIWRWYLYRRRICRAAQPNPAHLALVDLETLLHNRFRLVTQNVDGLHLRAGNSLERCYQVHGNIDYMRCLDDSCDSGELQPVPDRAHDDTDILSDEGYAALSCRHCAGLTRPHVLWFDEHYDEQRYRADSAMKAARDACVVVTVGTSGAAAIPHHVFSVALNAGTTVVDINPHPNPFSQAAESATNGHWVRDEATSVLPALVSYLSSN